MKKTGKALLFIFLTVLLALSLFYIERESGLFSSAFSAFLRQGGLSSSAPQESGSPSGEASVPAQHGADFIPVDGSGSLTAAPQDRTPQNTGEAESFPPLFYPYREMLSDSGKKIYNQVYANAQALNSSFFLVCSSTPEELETVFSAVLFDHPELFWLSSDYQYEYTSGGEVVSMALSFNETAQDIRACRLKFEAAVSAAANAAAQYDDPLEQEKYVHDYLLDRVEYDLSEPLNQSAYSALVRERSVCAGYSRAFQLIMTRLGVPCYYCVGEAGGNHAWNIIGLEDGFYHVDVSWDDPVGNPPGERHYEYFNLTDEEISSDHTRTRLSLYLPQCSGPVWADRTPSGLKTYSQLGFSEEDILYTLEDYYGACRTALVRKGTGNYSLSFLLASQALQEDIYASAHGEEHVSGYLEDTAEELGLNGCSYQFELSAQPLDGGYYVLFQEVWLEEGLPENAPSASPSPDEAREAVSPSG